MPRNELHCIIQVSCFGTLLKGQLSKDLLFVLHSQLFSRGALKPTEGQTRLQQQLLCHCSSCISVFWVCGFPSAGPSPRETMLRNLAFVCSAFQTWVGMSPADAQGIFSNQINVYFTFFFPINFTYTNKHKGKMFGRAFPIVFFGLLHKKNVHSEAKLSTHI